MQNNKGGITVKENKTCPDQEWKQLSTAELDHILQAELEKEHPNEEVVLPILRTLEDREKDYPVEETPEILALVNGLSEHESSSKQSKSKRRWVAGIAAVAAVACIIVMALPRTVGAESIFDVLFRWTSSIFEFVDPDREESYPDADVVFVTDNPGLQQLYDKMVELGVEEPVVPMWLPESYELLNLRVTPLRDAGYKVNAVFRENGKGISITYRISRDITMKFEKEENDVEVIEAGGKSHFVMDNGENLSVTWTIDGIECLINTDASRDDVYTIIKSIYRRPLE